VKRGEVVAIVGESGCGKSVSSLAIMRLLPRATARITSGRIMLDGRNLLELSDDDMREVRGRDISMIFQEPMTSLNPVLTIGLQIMEPLFIHLKMTETEARARAIELLELVGITDAQRRLDQYPHQFSGGMRQRVMIAMAIACNPDLLIADEPTTALDVTVQAQVFETLMSIKDEIQSAMILITHDLGVVAGMADRALVMYAGQAVELATTDELFYETRHPYTLGLLASLPRLSDLGDEPLRPIRGAPPSLIRRPSGCAFHPRCDFARPNCSADEPALRLIEGEAHLSRCHYAEELRDVTLDGLRRAAT
jgi:oligopeptide/dipeptide ABC transporter ATP-binding protein